ncbi:MAG: carboxypeptidase-like regulatory domain-containing protein [Planctomycetaceae bacterium]|nr:carboxypeptidase-like regulatory domain-containing protein [Planctomycetaceae bacterium]
MEIVTKLRGRPQTTEELDARWGFIISGTVRDINGQPLEQAKVTVQRNDIYTLSFGPPRSSTTTNSDGQFVLRFNPYALSMMEGGRGEPPTPEKPSTMGIRVFAEKIGFVNSGMEFVCVDPIPSDPENVSYHSWMGEITKKLAADEMVLAKTPKELDFVLEPSILFRGTVFNYERDPIPGFTPDMVRWSCLEAAPREGEQANNTRNFYGRDLLGTQPNRFYIDATPNESSYRFAVSFFSSRASDFIPEKNTWNFTTTDYFSLPPAGIYDVTFRWTTTEKNGVKVRQVVIDSVKDVEGNSVTLNVTKKAEIPEHLFLRWTLNGTVRDDLGNPLEGVNVQLHRNNEIRNNSQQTVMTTADGKYSFELLASSRFAPSPKGEFLHIKAVKDGFFDQDMNQKNLIFLSGEKNPSEQTFASGRNATTQFAVPLEPSTFDVVLNRNPVVEGILRGNDGELLAGHRLMLRGDFEFDDVDSRRPDIDRINTDRNGKFRIEKFPADTKFWFVLDDWRDNDDILRTNNITFAPGTSYRVGLRLQKDDAGNRRLVLDTVTDADGKDVASQIVSEDTRTKPLLSGEPEKQGREIIDRMLSAVTPMLRTTTRDVATLTYTFHLRDKPSEVVVSPYSGNMFVAERVGITRSWFLNTVADSTRSVRFRSIEENDDEIRLYTNLTGRYGVGNGIKVSWAGYSSGRFSEAQIVLDAKTFLPKRMTAEGFEEEYSGFVPLGDGFVPLRILSKTSSGMAFDFHFKVHEPGVWLFDHDVYNGEVVCRIDNVQIEKAKRASPEEENKVREALRKMKTANEYWLQWYPKDLPEFSYTFHREGVEPRVLTWKEIKEADNWYAEFYRKGISYIGVSRLLLIDIDGLRCASVSEDTEKCLLTFEFELSQEWMNAFGNGISGTWNGWFNGVIGKGTAIIDTKTATLIEVKTRDYDERYSDYFEIKPGKFVPRRIVIDYHKGNRDAEPDMFFDFRFKVYEPCLWLFDRSVVKDKEPIVRVSDVLVNGEPGIEMLIPK